ncbi:hypothetical protein [Georgenia satyanarayanai]|uniref:hypothetical protein n=1 Tax=Georgenia satyanarayanai TaxID=860221 RepID=UPI0012651062|nr:hypothetical protein [Georgenia satyanarayanai]
MEQLLLIVFGPALLGLVAALVVVWAVTRSQRPRLAVGRGVRWWTLAGVVLASAIVLAQQLPLGTPWHITRLSPTAHMMTLFTVPIVAGLISVVVLTVPVERRSGGRTAELHRRTLTSFSKGGWFLTLAATVVLTVAVAVWAGRASVPDDQGRYTMYWIDLGPGGSMGSSIYGWHFSVPSLALVALLVTATLLAAGLIARPPLAQDRENDVAVRRWRTRNVMAMATGALLLHLARVVNSLAGTAGIYGQTQTGQGLFTKGTPFAGLEGPLRVAADALEVCGWFFWFAVLFIALRASAQTRDNSRSRAPWSSRSS